MFTVYLGPFYMSESSGEFVSNTESAVWHERYLDMMNYTGFRNALLSTLRTMTGDPFDAYRALGQLDRPVLILWGGDDDTSRVENAPQVMKAIPQAELHLIPGARHAFAYEFPEKVNPLSGSVSAALSCLAFVEIHREPGKDRISVRER